MHVFMMNGSLYSVIVALLGYLLYCFTDGFWMVILGVIELLADAFVFDQTYL